MTGILRFAKTGIFSGMNNFSSFSVLEDKFSKFFGFTQEEIKLLIDRQDLLNVEDRLRVAYNGYQNGDQLVYNPWSVMNCFDKLQEESRKQNPKPQSAFGPYWVNTGSIELL